MTVLVLILWSAAWVLACAALLGPRAPAALRASVFYFLLFCLCAVWWFSAGRPRPAPTLPSGQVLAVQILPQQAVYVWMALGPGRAPRAVRLSWSAREASRLLDALRQARVQHGQVLIGKARRHGPGHQSWLDTGHQTSIWVRPQMQLPRKPQAAVK